MKSPREIAAESVQDEIYARAAFARLIPLPPAEFRSAVEQDCRARTEAMARLILDYCDETYQSIPPEHALELIQAADVAASRGEPHIRLRIAKDFANTYRYLGRFADAAAALRCAESLATRTFATDLHEVVVEFARLALADDTEPGEPLTTRAEGIIRRFEENRAPDRAYLVRLYDAFMKSRRGEHVAALAAYQDAVSRALASGSEEDIAGAYYNIAQCFRALSDFSVARTYFAEAARLLYSRGITSLGAKALRCAARMTIRMQGEAGIAEIDAVKDTFLALHMAGEVCRSTLAIIEELSRRDPKTDLTDLCRAFEDEIIALGVAPLAGGAINRLKTAIRNRSLTDEVLQDAWNAFGPAYSIAAISAVTTVRN